MTHVIDIFEGRECANFVILAGQQFVMIAEKPIVGPLTTPLLKSWKVWNMTSPLIYGVWEF
jgi:hypothetical protein